MIAEIFVFCLIDCLVWLFYTSILVNEIYFNPIGNYEKWDSMNWFGVWFLTILYWIVFFAPTIICVVWIGFYKLFTVGRR